MFPQITQERTDQASLKISILESLITQALHKVTPDPTERLLIEHSLEGGIIKTAFDYFQRDESFRNKVDAGAFYLLKFDLWRAMMRRGVLDFVRATERKHYVETWIHVPSKEKTDIGYDHKEVAITLAYATDSESSKFLVFTRDNEDKINTNIPRKVVKRLVGAKDIMRAAQQAEKNLEGIAQSGDIGPFGLKERDLIFVDGSSYKESLSNPNLLANFSAGPDFLSINIRLCDAVSVLGELYPGRVAIVDLWD